MNLKNVKKRFSHPYISQSGTSVITSKRDVTRNEKIGQLKCVLLRLQEYIDFSLGMCDCIL